MKIPVDISTPEQHTNNVNIDLQNRKIEILSIVAYKENHVIYEGEKFTDDKKMIRTVVRIVKYSYFVVYYKCMSMH